MPLRDRVANTSIALLLVLVVVGVAMVGRRPAGLAAAVSATVGFDFFWTEPFETFAIRAADDVETAVLLLLAGVAITEIVAWGRREQAAANREAGFRDGLMAAAEAVASGDSPSRVIDRVAGQLVPLLRLDRCRFDYGTGLDHPRLEHDGSVVWRNRTVDVDAEGFPSERPTELLVESGGRFRGRFLLTAGAMHDRPEPSGWSRWHSPTRSARGWPATRPVSIPDHAAPRAAHRQGGVGPGRTAVPQSRQGVAHPVGGVAAKGGHHVAEGVRGATPPTPTPTPGGPVAARRKLQRVRRAGSRLAVRDWTSPNRPTSHRSAA